MIPALPPEIVIDILELSLPPLHRAHPLQPRYDLLLSYCLVSHAFRSLAQPLLFIQVEYESANKRLNRLGKAIRSSPELSRLARTTKVVRIGAIGGAELGKKPDDKWRRTHALHPELEVLWIEAAPGLDVGELSCFEKLRFLHLGERTRPWVRLVPPLPSLKYLSISNVLHAGTANGRDLQHILSALIGPLLSLRHLSILGYPSAPLRQQTPLSAQITSLVLRGDRSFYFAEQVDIIAFFPCLQHLHIGYWRSDVILPDRLANLPRSVSLRTLKVEVWRHPNFIDEDEQPSQREILVSIELSGLTQLKKLEVNYHEGVEEEVGGDLRRECEERSIKLIERRWSEDEQENRNPHDF